MRDKKNIFMSMAVVVGLFTTYSCLDPYSAPASRSNVNYLVVEGFLTIGLGTTTIKLSHTRLLSADNQVVAESNASVFIEGEDGSTYTLPESVTPGTYIRQNLIIDPTKNYRLGIKTSSHKEYASDFVPFKQAPAIDSITWAVEDSNVHIYANAHDDQGNTRYYFWKFNETWSYHSAYYSVIKFDNGQVLNRDLTDDIYHCWSTLPSAQVLINSTTRLSKDMVSNYLLQSIPLTSGKLQTEYSILVDQYALSKDAYEYWEQVKKNTENIGTIFGPQPSQIVSNIRCLTNPHEPVVGYFSASSVQQQRIFIFINDLPRSRHITGYEYCEVDTLFLNNVSDFHGSELLIENAYKGLTLVGYLRSTSSCVDCRLIGGSTVKPDFWK